MINSELLREAIIDAKAVRATALANAKASLEEAFAPRFEAMFAEKLKEEADEEDESLQEVEAPNQVSGKGGEAKGPSTKPVTKGTPQVRKSAAGDEDFKPFKAGKGPSDVANPAKTVNETAEEEEEDECKSCGNPSSKCTCDESINEAGLTSEDLDEIIRELEDEVTSEEEGKTDDSIPVPAVPEEPENDEPSPESDEIPPVPKAKGDEIPPSPESDENPEADIVAEPGSEVNVDLDDKVGPVPQGMNAGGNVEGKPKSSEDDEDEDINLDELLAALNEEADEEEEEEEKKMDESTLQNDGVPTNELEGQDKAGGVKGYPSAPQDASKKQIKGKNHNIQGAGNIGSGAVGGKPMQEQYKIALQEAYKTIEFLRGQINEVNLLNSKLIYTNKLFKEFAGVLDDSYRMKIVESFDLTKSVRETKLAYALLAESLNFGMQVAKTQQISKSVVKPPSVSKSQVKQITEGFASKPVSSTKPSQLITESNEMALRFKKLAGIKDTPKDTTVVKK